MDLRESESREGLRHPWETARAEFLVTLLRRHARTDADRVLDVGSGDGWFASSLLSRLDRVRSVVCVDSEYDDAKLAKLAFPDQVRGRRTLPDGSFDLLLALDVAEHVEDDVAFLRALRARAAPTSTLLFTVPAWPALFSAHDRALLHFRRYTHTSARDLLVASGFRVIEDGGFFHALIAPRLLSLGAEKLGIRGDEASDVRWRGGEFATRAIGAVLGAENALTHLLGRLGVSLPGLSYYAIAVPS